MVEDQLRPLAESLYGAHVTAAYQLVRARDLSRRLTVETAGQFGATLRVAKQSKSEAKSLRDAIVEAADSMVAQTSADADAVEVIVRTRLQNLAATGSDDAKVAAEEATDH